MSDSTHPRLPRPRLKPLPPQLRRRKFALLLSNRQVHRLCLRMGRSFE